MQFDGLVADQFITGASGVGHATVWCRPGRLRARGRGLPGDNEPDKIKELIGHPKERAEHVMLIDLERNDLGRVCVPGSVHVDELMSIESYRHVHHIVSNVSGRLAPDRTPGQIIAAVFPGGTITGCPKVRCMQIIAELEETGRGPYTGALGYINRNGRHGSQYPDPQPVAFRRHGLNCAPAPASWSIPSRNTNCRKHVPRPKACCARWESAE